MHKGQESKIFYFILPGAGRREPIAALPGVDRLSPDLAAELAVEAAAVGVAGVFIETHEDPDNAPSDGPNMVPLDRLEGLLRTLMAIDKVAKSEG